MAATLTPGMGRGWREPPAAGMSQLRSARCLPVFINLLINFWNSCPEPGRTSPPTLRKPLPKAGGCGEGTIAAPDPPPVPRGTPPEAAARYVRKPPAPLAARSEPPSTPPDTPRTPGNPRPYLAPPRGGGGPAAPAPSSASPGPCPAPPRALRRRRLRGGGRGRGGAGRASSPHRAPGAASLRGRTPRQAPGKAPRETPGGIWWGEDELRGGKG